MSWNLMNPFGTLADIEIKALCEEGKLIIENRSILNE